MKQNRLSTLCLFIAGLIFIIPVSIIVAYWGALIAGVKSGGWNWQFLPAIYLGGLFGVIAYCSSFIATCKRQHDSIFAFSISCTGVPLMTFILSPIFHKII